MLDVKFRWRLNQPLVINIPKFTVIEKETLFISGPSGSGKSTLLNLLGGIIQPETGDIVINSENIVQLSSEKRDAFRADQLGLLFQMFNLMPFLSVVKNVTLPCLFSTERHKKAVQKSGSIKAEAERLLLHMGLDPAEIGDRPVNLLSAGQQQRVAAARALLGNPKLVIADEPTSALDSDTRYAFMELLFTEVRASGATLIFVSHDKSLSQFFDKSVSFNGINESVKEQGFDFNFVKNFD